MLRWLGKTLLFRILPRKLLPILTAIEVVRFIRNARNPRTGSDPRLLGSQGGAGGGPTATRGGRAVPGGLGLPSMRPAPRPARRDARVVGTSGPDPRAARGGGATVPR